MGELEIPTRALSVAYGALLSAVMRGADEGQMSASVVYAAGPHIVAAELRGFADAYANTIPADHLSWDDADVALNGVVNELRSRADELDGAS